MYFLNKGHLVLLILFTNFLPLVFPSFSNAKINRNRLVWLVNIPNRDANKEPESTAPINPNSESETEQSRIAVEMSDQLLGIQEGFAKLKHLSSELQILEENKSNSVELTNNLIAVYEKNQRNFEIYITAYVEDLDPRTQLLRLADMESLILPDSQPILKLQADLHNFLKNGPYILQGNSDIILDEATNANLNTLIEVLKQLEDELFPQIENLQDRIHQLMANTQLMIEMRTPEEWDAILAKTTERAQSSRLMWLLYSHDVLPVLLDRLDIDRFIELLDKEESVITPSY
jgi:hypothetical protein